jgi:hypothetical protein
VAVLAALWAGRAWVMRRRGGDRDPALVHARERRGF